jgi:hypothetical protein
MSRSSPPSSSPVVGGDHSDGFRDGGCMVQGAASYATEGEAEGRAGAGEYPAAPGSKVNGGPAAERTSPTTDDGLFLVPPARVQPRVSWRFAPDVTGGAGLAVGPLLTPPGCGSARRADERLVRLGIEPISEGEDGGRESGSVEP